MEGMKPALIGVLIVTVLAWLAFEVFYGAPVIRLQNHSSETIESIVISGSGFESRVARLGPGEAVCIRPHGLAAESTLHVSGTVGGRLLRASDLTYFEARGRYRVHVDIEPVLQVHASWGSAWLALCGWW